jgi:putative peptidoglycan lipid II flippase
MDAFLAAFLIPNLLINLIAESMNQALIPTLIRVRLQQGHARAQQLLSHSMLATSSMLIAVSLVMAVLARFFFPLIGSNFGASKLTLSVHLFYALLPCVVLGGVASNCTAVLNTLGRFTWPALAPLIVSACIVLSTLAFHHPLGVWALALATIAGTALQAGALAAGMHTRGYAFQLRWHRNDEAGREVARHFGPVLSSSVVASGGLLVDQAMAAMLPAGSVSALVFAGRFTGVVITLLAGSLATAVAPYFSELAARRDWPACRAALRSWTARAAAVSVPTAIALILGAHPLVRITLQHGAFTARDSTSVASVLVMYAVQIPFFAVSRVYYRFVVAMRRTDLVFYCGTINLVLDVALNLILMRRMGVAGIALSTSLWTVTTCLLFWYWSRRLLAAAETESVHR